MKSLIGSLIGLVLSVSVGAEPLLEGRVRLSSGQPAAGVQVRLFDLTDLRRSVGTTTDETGHFALPLRALSTARGTALPTDFALGQNYPNPFNPSTIIPYQLPAAGHVRLEVFNVLGQRLATLVDAERSAGAHTAHWDGTDAAGRAVGAGVYIYRLSSGGMTESRRMVLVDGQAGIPAVGAAAQGPVRAAEGAVEADDRVYGLTVSGVGLVAYVNPAFRVGVDEVDIVIEKHDGSPRMKLAARGILGDVNNDGKVDVFDALYVLLYSEDPSIMLPNNGDISLGDVNGDGRVDIADAVILIRYISDPSDSALPSGIGDAAPALVLSALSQMYWTEGGTDYDGAILRAHLDGSNVDTLVIDLDEPRGLALDMVEDYIYWTDMVAGNIYRAHLDGSNVDTLVIDLDEPRGLALDVARGHMYWTVGKGGWGGTIHRANLDGSNDEILTLTSEPPRGLALDVVGGYMYWTGFSAIYRADLDGSKIEIEIPDRPNIEILDWSNIEILVTGLDDPKGLALDVAGGYMYWTDTDLGTILRADLDGSNIEILVTGLGDPEGLALDVVGGHMYWTDTDSGYRTGNGLEYNLSCTFGWIQHRSPRRIRSGLATRHRPRTLNSSARDGNRAY